MYRIFCLIVSMITHCAVLDAQTASFPDSTRSCPGCDPRRALLDSADLRGARLDSADLRRVRARGAHWLGASLRGVFMHEPI